MSSPASDSGTPASTDAISNVERAVGSVPNLATPCASLGALSLNAILPGIDGFVFLLEADGTIVDCRIGESGELYIPPEAFLGRRIADVLPADIAARVADGLARAAHVTVATVDYSLQYPDGPRDYSARLMPLADERFLAIVTRLRTGARTEAELRMKDLAIETSLTAWCLTDADGRVAYTNAAFQRMWGYTAAEAAGRLPTDFTDEASAASLIGTLEREGVVQDEIVGRRKDGSTFDALVSASVVRDDDGRLLHMMAWMVDITERKRTEARILRLNEELEARVRQRTTALEAANRELEAFGYSVSHDLRAPLRAMSGYTEILLEDFGETLGGEGRRLCGVVREEASRMGRLIDDLLAFSRIGRLAVKLAPVDMHSLVESVAAQVIPADRRDAVRLDIAALPPAVGDAALLRQVWTNLLQNAVKFTALRRLARIEVTGERIGGESTYTVRDNGAGFDMAYAHKLFGVFQRLHTEAEFPGTGVGLAIVQRIVQRLGGRVRAKGRIGEGAEFSFTLPAGETST